MDNEIDLVLKRGQKRQHTFISALHRNPFGVIQSAPAPAGQPVPPGEPCGIRGLEGKRRRTDRDIAGSEISPQRIETENDRSACSQHLRDDRGGQHFGGCHGEVPG